VHSLFRERVNGVVTNTDDWYDLFDVKPTDKLYLAPEKRIRSW
jgi:predicted metalloendopeptidase